MKTNHYKLVPLAVILFSSACLARLSAAPVTVTTTYNPDLTIPDNNLNGVASTELFNTSSFSTITSVQVSLDISGGYNGDFYAYLTHGGTGFAVLLNRPGVTASNPFGYSDSGINVTFSDTAANGDIHSYQNTVNPNGGALTGIWQPDGRTADPSVVTDASARTAFLSSFDGSNANGDWTLFISDDSAVGIGTLESWSLSVTGDSNAVPDAAGTAGLLGFSSAVLLVGGRLPGWLQAKRNLPAR